MNDPILLTPKHWFSTLLIRDHHCRVHHNGIRDTLNSVRGTNWIIKWREAVKQVIRKCVICLKIEGRPYPTGLHHLYLIYQKRVSEGPPFVNTVVDFAGSLYAQSKSQVGEQVKAYVCLFTCASTQAIHLELIPDLSAIKFLLVFRRFTNRRGTPSTMTFDNAKLFKAASAVIQKVV